MISLFCNDTAAAHVIRSEAKENRRREKEKKEREILTLKNSNEIKPKITKKRERNVPMYIYYILYIYTQIST